MKDKKFKILVSWRKIIPALKDYKKILTKKKIQIELKKTKQNLKESELLKIVHKYEGIICGDDEITKKVIDKAKKLRVVSKWGSGIDSINTEYAKKKKIKVYNSPGVFSDSVAQTALGMMLLISRKIFENHSEVIKGRWPKPTGFSLKNKYLGVIGLGKMGQSLINTCKGLEMKVLGNDRKKINKRNLKKLKIKIMSKNKLLRKADVVVLCVDLNKTSYRLINFKEFNIIKKNAILINVCRGPVIYEKALVDALKKRKLFGAGIDVFEKEPVKLKNKLLKLKNCIFTSHNAFNTIEAVKQTNKNTIENLLKAL